jgi:hypothetical protein
MKEYSRPVRVTASGLALDRPCRVSGITITAYSKGDSVIHLKDGATGQRIWSGEADSSSSSFSRAFIPPMRFFYGLYVEFDQSDVGTIVTCEVLEK